MKLLRLDVREKLAAVWQTLIEGTINSQMAGKADFCSFEMRGRLQKGKLLDGGLVVFRMKGDEGSLSGGPLVSLLTVQGQGISFRVLEFHRLTASLRGSHNGTLNV